MSVAAPSPPASPALRSFEALWMERAASGGDALNVLQGSAMQRLLRLGLPTSRDETWRYTNLRRLAAQSYIDAPSMAPAELAAPAVHLGETATALHVINGHPVPHKALGDAYKNIEVINLRELSQVDPDRLAALIGASSDAEQARWELLNAALFSDGLYIKIKESVVAPVVILHFLTAEAPHSIANPRIIIDAAPGSRATIIEQFVEQGTHPPLCNSATHILAAADAHIEHYRVFTTGARAEHMDSLRIELSRNSRCTQFTLALGGGLVRTLLEADLRQPGAALDSYSLLVGQDARHVDCVNIVSHKARDTRSAQTARAIAGGDSRVIFNTKVVVDAGAVHADSRQSCRGLLLSPTAEIDTRPQLEIHADEVKCAHGASIGRLDPDMLFYLLTRGVDRNTAQTLLVFAFLSDVLTPMSVPSARAAIETALVAQLPDSHILNQFR